MDNRKVIYLDNAIDALIDYFSFINPIAFIDVLSALPSAQLEEIALHESCTDCPLYDKNRQSCPRFNKVIPEVLREVQSEQRWIPVTERLPEIYQRVLTTIKGDRVRENFRLNTKNIDWSYGSANSVIAWMPLPTPWEGGQDG